MPHEPVALPYQATCQMQRQDTSKVSDVLSTRGINLLIQVI
jgi:hypothetical protein